LTKDIHIKSGYNGCLINHPFQSLDNQYTIDLANRFALDMPNLATKLGNDEYPFNLDEEINKGELHLVTKRFLLWYEFFEGQNLRHTFLEKIMERSFIEFSENNLLEWDLYKVEYVFSFYRKLFSWCKPCYSITMYTELFSISLFYSQLNCNNVRSLRAYCVQMEGKLDDNWIRNAPQHLFYKFPLPEIWLKNYFKFSEKELIIISKVGKGENIRTSNLIRYPISKKESSLLFELPGIHLKNDIIDSSIVLAKLLKGNKKSIVTAFYEISQRCFTIHNLYDNLDFWQAFCYKMESVVKYLFAIDFLFFREEDDEYPEIFTEKDEEKSSSLKLEEIDDTTEQIILNRNLDTYFVRYSPKAGQLFSILNYFYLFLVFFIALIRGHFF
jgi:hypothetical protein